MSLIKCKECNGQVSTSAKFCPHCGTKKFNKKNIGCGTVLIVFILLVGLFSILTSNSKTEKKHSDISKSYFFQDIGKHYLKTKNAIETDNLEIVIKQYNLFKKYNRVDYSDFKTIVTNYIDKKVKPIPAEDVEKNLELYLILQYLNPENIKYTEKMKFYRDKNNEILKNKELNKKKDFEELIISNLKEGLNQRFSKAIWYKNLIKYKVEIIDNKNNFNILIYTDLENNKKNEIDFNGINNACIKIARDNNNKIYCVKVYSVNKDLMTKRYNKKNSIRKEQIENIFSSWDGSNRTLVNFIKNNMHDPKSFSHEKTMYRDDEMDYIDIIMTFRGNNAFGAKTLHSVSAKYNLNANELYDVKFD